MRGAQPLSKYTVGGSLATPTAPQITDVDPNRCGEPLSRPHKNPHTSGRGGGQSSLNPGEAFLITSAIGLVGLFYLYLSLKT
jgi:hypothetical protein